MQPELDPQIEPEQSYIMPTGTKIESTVPEEERPQTEIEGTPPESPPAPPEDPPKPPETGGAGELPPLASGYFNNNNKPKTIEVNVAGVDTPEDLGETVVESLIPSPMGGAGNPNALNQEELIKSREANEAEWGYRAKQRNSYRQLWKKVFGIDKTERMDIAVEEAIRMDAAIDELRLAGKASSAGEAIKLLDKSGEFGLKGVERIQQEEYVRYRLLEFGSALEKNDIYKAKIAVEEILDDDKIEDEVKALVTETAGRLVGEKVAQVVTERDGKGFVRVFNYLNGLHAITAEAYPEATKMPEISAAIKKDLAQWLSIKPEYFAQNRASWAEAGFIKPEEINKSPEIQIEAKTQLISWMKTKPEYFAEHRDKLAEIGIVNPEEANQMEEIQLIARKKLVSWMQTNPEYFAQYRDEWAALGIVDKEAVSLLPEIQQEAKKQLLSWMQTNPEYFAEYRDRWAALGIVNPEEANQWPEVIDALQTA